MTEATQSSLSDWMRKRLSDSHRFLLLCALVGLLCGLAAVGFDFAIRHIFDWLWGQATSRDPLGFCAILLLGPTLGGLLIGVAVKYYCPDGGGSGIPQVKTAYYNKGGKVHIASGAWRFFLGALYVGLGNSLGREGPTVHFCAAISSKVGRWAFRDPARSQSMLPVGMAAGIAAAFNAPLSALTFVFEELLDNFSMKAIGGMVVAVVISAAVSRTIRGEDPVLSARLGLDYKTSAWMLVALPMGVCSGLIGNLFTISILHLRSWFNHRSRIPGWLCPAVGGLSCGILGVSCFYFTGHLGNASNSVFSIGYSGLESAFQYKLSIAIIGVLLVLKFLAVVVNYSSGGSGGLFSPTLFLGGMLGGIIGGGLVQLDHIGNWIPAFPPDPRIIGGCVLLGMGAMFAAVIRCPFTSIFIIFEMTGNYSLILPLMAGNIIAWQVGKQLHPVSIYNALLLQDGISLRTMSAYRGHQDYRNLPVQSIMTHDVFSFPSSMPPEEALKRIALDNMRFRSYPVVDDEQRLVGIVSHLELTNNRDKDSIYEIIFGQEITTVTLDSSIQDAANQMISKDLQQLAVVSPANRKKMLGWLTLNDIAREQNAAED